jgi:hypothetical protein
MSGSLFLLLPVQRKGKGTPAAASDGDPNSRKAGESDQNIRKVLARQHAKDISEYTKQIHAKDREIADLKKKTIKVWNMHVLYGKVLCCGLGDIQRSP